MRRRPNDQTSALPLDPSISQRIAIEDSDNTHCLLWSSLFHNTTVTDDLVACRQIAMNQLPRFQVSHTTGHLKKIDFGIFVILCLFVRSIEVVFAYLCTDVKKVPWKPKIFLHRDGVNRASSLCSWTPWRWKRVLWNRRLREQPDWRYRTFS